MGSVGCAITADAFTSMSMCITATHSVHQSCQSAVARNSMHFAACWDPLLLLAAIVMLHCRAQDGTYLTPGE